MYFGCITKCNGWISEHTPGLLLVQSSGQCIWNCCYKFNLLSVLWFPSCLSPQCFKASPNVKPFIWKLVLFTCKWTKICMRIKLISMWKTLHLDSLWNRGERQLGSRLLMFTGSVSSWPWELFGSTIVAFIQSLPCWNLWTKGSYKLQVVIHCILFYTV